MTVLEKFEKYVAEHWYSPEVVKHDFGELSYIYTCLAGECGEIGDAIKKLARGRRTPYDIALEMGDTLHYLVKLAHHLGYSLEEIMTMNVDKLEERFNKDPNWLLESKTAA